MANWESNVEEVEDMKTHKGSSWGNDEITLSMDDVAGILQGKTYFYFDGEYGHYIHMKKEEEK